MALSGSLAGQQQVSLQPSGTAPPPGKVWSPYYGGAWVTPAEAETRKAAATADAQQSHPEGPAAGNFITTAAGVLGDPTGLIPGVNPVSTSEGAAGIGAGAKVVGDAYAYPFENRDETRAIIGQGKHDYLDRFNYVGDPGHLGNQLEKNGLGDIVTTDYGKGPNGENLPGPGTQTHQQQAAAAGAGGGGAGGLISETAAGKAASAYAERLAQAQSTLATPAYGTAPQVPVGQRPADAQAGAAWDQIYGGTAQQSGPTGGTSRIAAPQIDYRFGMQAPQAGAPQIGGAPQINEGSLPYARALNIAAPGSVRAGSVTAQQIGAPQMAGARDIATDSPERAAQLRALGLYEGAANGTAPSAAEALLRKGIDENIGAQLGIAGTLQGNTPGLALRSGLAGAQGAIAKSSADMAALRAEEQERGRAGFLAAATGIRGQDIAVAQSNQTKDMTTQVTNLNSKLESLKANQAAALSAGQSNVAADLQSQIANATNQLDAAKSRAQVSLSADIANLTAALDARKSNQAAQVSTNIANLNSQMEITRANLQSALQTGLAAEASRLQTDLARMQAQQEAQWRNQQAMLEEAKLSAQNEQFNAGLRQNQQQFTSAAAQNAAQQNASNTLRQQEQNNALYLGLTDATRNALAVPVGVATNDIAAARAKAQADKDAAAAEQAQWLKLFGTIVAS